MIFTENIYEKGERENTNARGKKDDDERRERRILSVHREESKDRPERREIPGILYRRRKTVSLKLHSISLSSTAFFVFFFSLFWLTTAKLTSKLARQRYTAATARGF